MPKPPLEIWHKECGETFYKTAQSFLKTGCPVCALKNRSERSCEARTAQGIQRFYEMLQEIQSRGYTFVGETCKGLGKRTAFLCSHCGEIWFTTAYSILNGRNHICVSPCKKKTHQEFVKQVFDLVGEEYHVLTKYQDAFTPIKMRHNLCGFTFMIAPAHFTSTGRRCPVCTRAKTHTAEETSLLKEHFSFTQNLSAALRRDRQNLAEKVPTYIDYLWDRKLDDAKAYYEEYGNVDIPYEYTVNGYRLGGWISEQRKSYRLGRLPQDRIDALNALHIKWQYKEEQWLCLYEQTKESLRVLQGRALSASRSKEERKLFYWLNDQTELYRKGRLSPEKRTLLEAIGVKQENKLDLRFEQMYEKLAAFKALHGHCVVPLKEGREDATPLGLWTQRMRQQLSSGQLSAERAKQLTMLGLPVDNKEAKFQYRFSLAQAYRGEFGHLKIPQSYEKDGCKLGKWINGLRVRYQKGKLPAEKIARLESIGMVWKTN